MNIESSSVKFTTETKQNSAVANNKESTIKFSDELENVKKEEANGDVGSSSNDKKEEVQNLSKSREKAEISNNCDKGSAVETIDEAFKNLNLIVSEINQSEISQDNKTNNFNQTEDSAFDLIKEDSDFDDNNDVINKDYSIQDNKDLLPQMNPNMNFSGNGQPFSSFMNNEQNQQSSNNKLSSTAKDLAEEAAILSTMAENIAIANKNELLKAEVMKENPTNSNNEVQDLQKLSQEKTVIRNDGVKKVDTKSGITTETVIKFDSIIMNQADVEVFANLAEKGSVELNSITTESAQKSVQISKTLADMLVKAKENSQPLRIDFDNNISVIIRISRDGKITADFLPSSQVAEAYLKENLPLLRQRFDEKNIDYDSLNQKERKDSHKEQNKKKGRNDE